MSFQTIILGFQQPIVFQGCRCIPYTPEIDVWISDDLPHSKCLTQLRYRRIRGSVDRNRRFYRPPLAPWRTSGNFGQPFCFEGGLPFGTLESRKVFQMFLPSTFFSNSMPGWSVLIVKSFFTKPRWEVLYSWSILGGLVKPGWDHCPDICMKVDYFRDL